MKSLGHELGTSSFTERVFAEVLLPYWVQMQPHFSDGWKESWTMMIPTLKICKGAELRDYQMKVENSKKSTNNDDDDDEDDEDDEDDVDDDDDEDDDDDDEDECMIFEYACTVWVWVW